MPKLDRIAVLQDELRECVSPADIKTSQQKLWLLRQQHSELDHRLALKCRQLESELEMLPIFRERYDRFMGWADDLEKRLDTLQRSSKVTFLKMIFFLAQTNYVFFFQIARLIVSYDPIRLFLLFMGDLARDQLACNSTSLNFSASERSFVSASIRFHGRKKEKKKERGKKERERKKERKKENISLQMTRKQFDRSKIDPAAQNNGIIVVVGLQKRTFKNKCLRLWNFHHIRWQFICCLARFFCC